MPFAHMGGRMRQPPPPCQHCSGYCSDPLLRWVGMGEYGIEARAMFSNPLQGGTTEDNMGFRDFESRASASSATPARITKGAAIVESALRLCQVKGDDPTFAAAFPPQNKPNLRRRYFLGSLRKSSAKALNSSVAVLRFKKSDSSVERRPRVPSPCSILPAIVPRP